jgi:hypothetical protein
MAKTLACSVGRHQWKLLFQNGQAFKVCVACGKEPRKPTGYKTMSKVRNRTSDLDDAA